MVNRPPRAGPAIVLAIALSLPACGVLIGIKDLTEASPNDGGSLDGTSDGNVGADGETTDGGATKDGAIDAIADSECGDTLQNRDHCGRCGHSCLGGACDGGACQPFELASAQSGVAGIALSATHVYFTSLSNHTVSRVPLDGGTVEVLASGPNLAFPTHVAVNATHVYWNDRDVGSGSIARCPISGCPGAPEVLASPSEPSGLALDSAFVYWADRNGGEIAKKPLGGGAVQLVADTSSTGALPVAVALSAPYVLWVEDFSGEVYRNEPADGGLVKVGVNGLSGREIVADTQFAYWAAADDVGDPGRIARAPRAGGPSTQLAPANGDPRGLALDDTYVYWSAWHQATDGGVLSAAVFACATAGCGSNPVVVAAAQSSPRGVAVDSSAIYWGASGAVMKVAKP